MQEKFYGKVEQNVVIDEVSRHVEEIMIKGFSIIPNLITEYDLVNWRTKIDTVYQEQERDFGRNALEAIQELDVCRSPLLYDLDFINIVKHPMVLEIVKQFLGEWFILNLQNANINRPSTNHHQSAWHRDLSYQNYIISKPLAINALWVIDEFSAETGGTSLLPFSHKMETLPSDHYIKGNYTSISASAGSVIIFDSMLFHKAGTNRSTIVRRAINHMYTTPIIKQQYDYPRALATIRDQLTPTLERLLGFTSPVHFDDRAWRKARASRLLGVSP